MSTILTPDTQSYDELHCTDIKKRFLENIAFAIVGFTLGHIVSKIVNTVGKYGNLEMHKLYMHIILSALVISCAECYFFKTYKNRKFITSELLFASVFFGIQGWGRFL